MSDSTTTQALIDEAADIAMGGWHSVEAGRAFANRVTDYLLSQRTEQQAGAAEPVAYMWQHDETGRIGFVEPEQLAMGFREANPRLHIIRPLFAHPPAAEPKGKDTARARDEALEEAATLCVHLSASLWADDLRFKQAAGANECAGRIRALISKETP